MQPTSCSRKKARKATGPPRCAPSRPRCASCPAPRCCRRARRCARPAPPGHAPAPLSTQPAADAALRLERAPGRSAAAVSPLRSRPTMVEPAEKEDPCLLCGGEGFTFQVREGNAGAVACECTRACQRCGGAGRLYARDDRGYEVLRGCSCGADPRRLALLSGLRLPLKFIDKTLVGYRA